ncbi:5-methylthioadenosine/S-adenosylhomocysteine deaminase [Methanococcus voltae]|uniref:amidohydrolase n=1 Tax=Methanococcus voltae TaxID=2188 RepID=UPI001AEB556D|nr:amidohydrolase [Methanococcus voltae]MBP2143747.1 5-methylthioadenosine/S-adenosylhomocysteine deaminase [Methanococcus voltae]
MIAIKNILVLNNFEEPQKCKKSDILIENNIITKVCDAGQLKTPEGAIVIDGTKKAIMPGLINTHTHIPMTIFRGVADDLPLMDWLGNHIWPLEAKLDDEIIYAGTMLGCMEMIKTGTVAFNDMYFFTDSIIKAVETANMRCTLSYGLIDLCDEEKKQTEIRAQKDVLNSLEKAHNRNGLINAAVGPHAPYTCSADLLQHAHELAKEHNIPMNIHMNETEDEIRQIKEKTGMRPFEFLNSLGVFDDINVVAAHCVHLSDNEINILKDKNIYVSHNPLSNLKLGSGIAPIPTYLKNNINVTLGTDGCASNNNLNLFESIKACATVHKGVQQDSTVVKVSEVLNMATKNASKALNYNSGEIKEGMWADLVILDLKNPTLIPNKNIISHLAYSFNGVVETVIINGKIVLENGKMTTMDEDKVYEKAEEAYLNLVN